MVKNSKAIVATAAIALVSLIAGIFIGVAVSLPFGRGNSGTVNPDSTVLTPTFKVDGENSYEDCEVFDFPSEMMFYQMSSTSTESAKAILVATVEPDGVSEEDSDVTWSVAWTDSTETEDINEYIQITDTTTSDNISLAQNQRAKAFVALKPWSGEICITVTTVIGGFSASCLATHASVPTSVKLFSLYGNECSKNSNGIYTMFDNDFNFQSLERTCCLRFYNVAGEQIPNSYITELNIDRSDYDVTYGPKYTVATLVVGVNDNTKYFDESTYVTGYNNPYFGKTEGGLGSLIEVANDTSYGWVIKAPNYCYTSVEIVSGYMYYYNYLVEGTPEIVVRISGTNIDGYLYASVGYENVAVTGVSLDQSEIYFTE